jgi:hypothetical protein
MMTKIKAGTQICISGIGSTYSNYRSLVKVSKLKAPWVYNGAPTVGNLFTVEKMLKHPINGVDIAYCVDDISGQGYLVGVGVDYTYLTVVTPSKPKAPRALYTHYSIQAKRNITREYLALPRSSKGYPKRGAVAELFHKYGVALKSPRHANSLLRGDTGWLYQYNNGGWDTSNAIAFKRTVEIAGVL